MIDLNLSWTAASASGWSALTAAFPVVLGATIGFGVSWFFARRTERDRKLALGYSLLMQAQAATETIVEIDRVMKRNLETIQVVSGQKSGKATTALPSGFDWNTRCEFDPAGLALLAVKGRFTLIAQLQELARLHDILLIMTSEYATRFERMAGRLREHERQVLLGVAKQELLAASQRDVEDEGTVVFDLLKQILEKAHAGSEFAKRVTSSVGPELKTALGDNRFRMTVNYAPKAANAAKTKDV